MGHSPSHESQDANRCEHDDLWKEDSIDKTCHNKHHGQADVLNPYIVWQNLTSQIALILSTRVKQGKRGKVEHYRDHVPGRMEGPLNCVGSVCGQKWRNNITFPYEGVDDGNCQINNGCDG